MQTIKSLDCELAVYRKGFLSVHVDLDRGYLTWRESNRWCNNFTRTMTPEQIQWLDEALLSSDILQTIPVTAAACQTVTGRLLTREEPYDFETPLTDSDESPAAAVPPSRLAWSLIYFTDQGCHELDGQGSLPPGWNQLSQIIETVSRLPFCL